MGSRFATTARLASKQHGRMAWQQLVDAGIDRHQIHRWLEDGRLHAVHRGVYAVGHVAPSIQVLYGDVVERGDATVADVSHRLEQAAAAA